MDQEEVWDVIAKPWQNFRTRTPLIVEDFLKDKRGKILDIGCGSGRNFVKVDGLEWYGVDFSKEMLKYSEKDAEEKGIDVKLQKACAEDLPFDDNYFDTVLCFAVLHCVDSGGKRERAIREIYRVLKPGAEAIISSWGAKSSRLKNKEKECFVPWTSRDGEKVKRYTYVYDLDELVGDCKDVGFEIVKSWEDRNVNVIVRKLL